MPLSRRAFGSGAVGAVGALLAPQHLFAIRSRPKLLLVLVAEQFRTDYLDRSQAYFSAGGFRRLLGEGAFLPDCRYLSSTFTGTGLATLMTGSWPQVHGIVADRWFDSRAGKIVPASLDMLQGTTLADETAGQKLGRVVALGGGPNYTALLAGRAASHAIAMDN